MAGAQGVCGIKDNRGCGAGWRGSARSGASAVVAAIGSGQQIVNLARASEFLRHAHMFWERGERSRALTMGDYQAGV